MTLTELKEVNDLLARREALIKFIKIYTTAINPFVRLTESDLFSLRVIRNSQFDVDLNLILGKEKLRIDFRLKELGIEL